MRSDIMRKTFICILLTISVSSISQADNTAIVESAIQKASIKTDIFFACNPVGRAAAKKIIDNKLLQEQKLNCVNAVKKAIEYGLTDEEILDVVSE